jgi:FkbM family methyltransferase
MTFFPMGRLIKMFQTHGIDLLLDIGANTGQFAMNLQIYGYKGRIVSFEPVRSAYDELCRNASRRPGWTAVRMGIGDDSGEMNINVSGAFTLSSSFAAMRPKHLEVAPNTAYTGKEKVIVRTVDNIFGDYCGDGDHIFMKVDTQGYEAKVIRGAEKSLPRIAGVQLELSLEPLYEGEVLVHEMIGSMLNKGYRLVNIEEGMSDPKNGHLLQCDCVFFREELC